MREYVFPNRIVAFVGVENQENLLIKKQLQIGLAETKTTLFEKQLKSLSTPAQIAIELRPN